MKNHIEKYFYVDAKGEQGPLSLDELKKVNIANDTLIWFEGMIGWTPASEIEALRPILELSPPPIPAIDNKYYLENSSEYDVGKKNQIHNKSEHGLKEASQGWLIAGFIFSLLGGYLGIAIGLVYAFGKYKKETKILGWIMAILGIFSAAIWISL